MNFVTLFSLISFIQSALANANAGLLQQLIAKLDSEVLSSELLVLASEFDDKFNAVLNNKQQPMLSTHELEDLYFHSNNCTVTTWNGKLYYDGKGKKTHTDLRRGIVVLHIKPNTLAVETSFKVNRLAVGDVTSLAIGNARTSYKDLRCDGMAALDFEPKLSIEWIQLFCDFTDAQIKTEVEIDRILRGKEVEMFISEHFGIKHTYIPMSACDSCEDNEDPDAASIKKIIGGALEEKLERDVTTGLEHLVSSWLQSRLDSAANSASLTSVTSQAYQQAAQQEALEANDVLDGILAFASSLIKENYNDSIRIPDIREGFEKNILHIVRVGAQFLATQGKAYGVSSIERVGTARLLRNGTNVYFSSAFRFKELFIMYDRYRAEVIGLGPTGTVSTSLAPVTARVMVRVDFKERKAYLDHLRIAELGKVNVRITGLGSVLNFIVSRVVTWVVAAFKNQILNLVEDRVRKYTREALERSSLDDILAGKAFKR